MASTPVANEINYQTQNANGQPTSATLIDWQSENAGETNETPFNAMI